VTLCRVGDEVVLSADRRRRVAGATFLVGWLLLRWSVPCLLLP
jgi:hypothetical protein